MANFNKSYENSFCNWLSSQVSPDQLSSIYSILRDISTFCACSKILELPLFQTDNLSDLLNVSHIIERGDHVPTYLVRHRKLALSAISYYRQYLITVCHKSPTIISDPHEITTPAANIESGKNLVDLIKKAQISYIDNRSKQGCLWILGNNELLPFVTACKKLGVSFHLKPEGTHATRYHSGWWTTDEISQKASSAVLQSLEVESGTRTAANDTNSASPALIVENRKKFIAWMVHQGIKSGTGMQFLSLIGQCSKYGQDNGLLSKDIYLITRISDLQNFYHKINTCPWFIKTNESHHNRLNTALMKYFQYLKENEQKCNCATPTSKPTASHSSNVIVTPRSTSVMPQESEVDRLLHDGLFTPLRKALATQGITTVDQLRSIKLWAFLNQYNLYTIATRQAVLLQVRDLLNPPEIIDPEQLFKLHYASAIFTGRTVSEAYLHFCEKMASNYPLRIRSILGKRPPDSNTVALSRNNIFDNSLKMENPTAYINANLSKNEVLHLTRWLCSMCGEPSDTISIESPTAHVQSAEKSVSDVEIVHNPISTPYSSTPDILPTTATATTSQPMSSHESVAPVDEFSIQKLEKIVLDADLDGISLQALHDTINRPMTVTKDLVSKSKHIVELKNKLVHEEAFIDWDEGAQQLEAIIKKLMQKNDGYVSIAQLYKYAHAEMNMFLNDNDIDDERTVYDIAQHLFEKVIYDGQRYTFTGKMHISDSRDAIGSNFDIFCKYAEDQGNVFAYADLTDYLARIGIKTGNLRMQLRVYSEPHFLYYDEGILIFSDNMNIDAAWKDRVRQALQKLFADVGDHIILREIQPFWFDQLPDLPGGYKWTPLLLQSVLRFYGKEFSARTIIAMESQGIETLHTMLVQEDSPIQNFGDVVIAYMLDNHIEQRSFEAEELRSILVDSNMIRGNELIYNMPKALGNDERFAWDAENKNVTIRM